MQFTPQQIDAAIKQLRKIGKQALDDHNNEKAQRCFELARQAEEWLISGQSSELDPDVLSGLTDFEVLDLHGEPISASLPPAPKGDIEPGSTSETNDAPISQNAEAEEHSDHDHQSSPPSDLLQSSDIDPLAPSAAQPDAGNLQEGLNSAPTPSISISQSTASPDPEEIYRHERVEDYIKRALDAESEGKFDLALDFISKAIKEEPGNREIYGHRLRIEESQAAARLLRLKECLKNGIDIASLDAAVTEVASLLATPEYAHDKELSQLHDEGKRRRDRFRESAQERTTQNAIDDLQTSSKRILELEAKIRQGAKTDYDSRGEQIIGIDQALEEARRRHPDMMRKAVNMVIDRAATFPTPATAIKHLEQSQQELEQFGLKSDQESLNRLNDEKEKYEAALELWKEADKLVYRSHSGDQDPLRSLELLLEAEQIYPGYENLEHKINTQAVNASMYVADTLKVAIKKASNLLEGEGAEALRLAQQGGGDLPVVYDQARRILNEAMSCLDQRKFPEKRRSEQLLEVIHQVEETHQAINSCEQRRKRIQVVIQQILGHLDKQEVDLAKRTYEELSGDIQGDEEIRLRIYPKLEMHFDAKEHLRLAESFYEAHQWESVLKELESVPSEGGLAERVRELTVRSKLHQSCNQLISAWERKDFETADQILRSILAFPNTRPGEVEQVCSNLPLDEMQSEIRHRREVNKQQDIPSRLDVLETDIESFKRHLGDKPDKDNLTLRSIADLEDLIDRADQLLIQVKDLLKHDSTKISILKNLEEYLQFWLHNLCVVALDKNKSQKRPDYLSAFNVAKKLEKNELSRNKEDRDLLRWAIEGYYDYQEKSISSRNPEQQDLESIIKNWEDAVTRLGDAREIRIRLREARKKYILFILDKKLHRLEFTEALSIINNLSTESNPAVFNPQVVFDRATVDEEVNKLSDTASVMQHAQQYFDRQDYRQAVDLLQTQYEVLKHEALPRHRTELIRKAIVELSDKAQKSIDCNDFLQAVRTYAAILGLDPNHNFAKGQISRYQIQVGREIDQVIEETTDFRINNNQNVEAELERARDLEARIKNMQAVCAHRPNGDQEKEKLISSENGLTDIITNLFRANEALARVSSDGSTWRLALKTGAWDDVNDIIGKLRNLLPPGHISIRDLEDQVRQINGEQEKLKNEIDKLKQYCNGDKFSDVLKQCETINQLVNYRPDEQFGLLPLNFSVMDNFLRRVIYFFEQPAQPVELTISKLAEKRLETLHQWNNFADRINRRGREVIKFTPNHMTDLRHEDDDDLEDKGIFFNSNDDIGQKILNHLSISSSFTRKAILGLGAYLDGVNKILIDYQSNYPKREVDSNSARDIKKKCDQMRSEIEAVQRTAQELLTQAESQEKQIQDMIDQLTAEISNGTQRNDQKERLQTCQEFYEDVEEDANNRFLMHLQETIDKLTNSQPGTRK